VHTFARIIYFCEKHHLSNYLNGRRYGTNYGETKPMARNIEKTLPTSASERSIEEWKTVIRSLSGKKPKQVIARERVLAIKDDILAARARGVSAVELARALSDSTASVSVRLVRELCAEGVKSEEPPQA
jgi:hypothetical protein